MRGTIGILPALFGGRSFDPGGAVQRLVKRARTARETQHAQHLHSTDAGLKNSPPRLIAAFLFFYAKKEK
jgi:hypothetical protein